MVGITWCSTPRTGSGPLNISRRWENGNGARLLLAQSPSPATPTDPESAAVRAGVEAVPAPAGRGANVVPPRCLCLPAAEPVQLAGESAGDGRPSRWQPL